MRVKRLKHAREYTYYSSTCTPTVHGKPKSATYMMTDYYYYDYQKVVLYHRCYAIPVQSYLLVTR